MNRETREAFAGLLTMLAVIFILAGVVFGYLAIFHYSGVLGGASCFSAALAIASVLGIVGLSKGLK